MILALLFLFFLNPASAQEGEEVVFTKKQIVFNNGIKLTVEVARTNEQRSRGLMFRKELPAGTGMLFVFPSEQPLGFWMKNTYVPLSIGYFNKRRVLTEIQDMNPPLGPVRDDQLPRFESKEPGLYALEVPQGWFTAQKIKPGAKFTLK